MRRTPAAWPASARASETSRTPASPQSSARAVPQAAEEHGDHQVAVRPQLSASVASQRDVEVIPQPARKRDVPARPELAEAAREVRAVEVDAEVESENAR